MEQSTKGVEHHVSDYVIKVVSRCNFRCTYCYIYELADRSYISQPFVMDEQTVRLCAQRIREHQKEDAGGPVRIVLHGGEPLLFGKERIEKLVAVFDEVLGPQNYLLGVQTNGILLDSRWIDLLAKLRIAVGVSLDGPAAYHDARRVDSNGFGTHDRVEKAIRLLLSSSAGRRIFSGVLAVVNPACPPEELYAYMRGLGIEQWDILLPDHNHRYPPDRTHGTGYGEWLVRLFCCWLEEDNPARVVGFFEDAMAVMLGKSIAHTFWGLNPLGVAVIETDGSLEIPEYFKACAEGITKTGLHVERDPVAALLDNRLWRLSLDRAGSLCAACRRCEWASVCGGGLLSHRYSEDKSFDNVSVYCEDLKYFLSFVRQRLDLHYAFHDPFA
ncbi:radical SAM protein [Gloeobacter morelensis]|uniref:radical SAM protein n=1 Tax=Gloeobacter morelensis TaxID=2907343 RepID=UPI001E33A086|nr:radical SAM protein [Gloeobacter morelensis]